MYKLYVKYLFEQPRTYYYEDIDVAKTAYGQMKNRYLRQGYGDDVYEEQSNTEWIYTVTRIPFYGRSGDPTTGEIVYSPTGMTDTIEIHLELQTKNPIDPYDIPCTDNPIKEHTRVGRVEPTEEVDNSTNILAKVPFNYVKEHFGNK